jgi:hypothetical protein
MFMAASKRARPDAHLVEGDVGDDALRDGDDAVEPRDSSAPA